MASTDRGNTSPTALSGSPAITPAGDRQAAESAMGWASNPVTSYPDQDRGATVLVSSDDQSQGGLPVPVALFKMTGYYATGATWETWTGVTPNAAPPSGHTLTFISYVLLAGGNSN